MRVLAGPEKKTPHASPRRRRRSPPITRWATPWWATSCRTPTRCTRSRSSSRGAALGFTISLPTEDKFLTTKGESTDTLAMTLGGRAAEEISVRRDHHRRRQRHREGHRHRQADDHALGHEREARAAHARPQPGDAVPGPRLLSSSPTTRRRSPAQIDDEIRRIIEEAHERAEDAAGRPARTARRHRPDPDRARDHRARRVRGAGGRQARRRGLPRARREGPRAQRRRRRRREARPDAAAAAGAGSPRTSTRSIPRTT